MIRASAALGLLLLAAPSPELRYFHFERPIQLAEQSAGQSCLVVDPGVFAHASAQLGDLRVFQGATETPFVVRSDVQVAANDQTIALLNIGKNGNETVFDGEMPAGHYSDLQLKITGHDFLATVSVSGSQEQSGGSRTKLGAFTIFDLNAQRLGRSTVLHLPESDFRFLHFLIEGPIAPKDVTGLSVTHLPASKPKFVGVVAAANSTTKNRNSVIEFVVPAHTPVDSVVFEPGQSPANFSRDVEISVEPVPQAKPNDSNEPPQPFTTSGNVLRVHSVQDGHRIDEEHLALDAPQFYFDGPAKWTITVENHDDVAIQNLSARLEMLERRLCFDAAAGAAYTLYYGDQALAPPQYDYASLFVMEQNPVAAQLGAEIANPIWQARPDERPFTEKHPILLWVALVLVIASLGAVAFRSFKTAPVDSSSK
jgi:hypothetical protein